MGRLGSCLRRDKPDGLCRRRRVASSWRRRGCEKFLGGRRSRGFCCLCIFGMIEQQCLSLLRYRRRISLFGYVFFPCEKKIRQKDYFPLDLISRLAYSCICSVDSSRGHNTTKGMKTQCKISKKWLYDKGYTIAGAARRIKRSHGHVSMVLSGERESGEVIRLLMKLPKRKDLVLRERVSR